MNNFAVALDMFYALLAMGRTTVLFRLGGRRAVARATRRAMAVVPAGQTELGGLGSDLWRTYRAFVRIKRLWPGEVMCLQSALALQAVLAKRDLAGAVRVGALREGVHFQAHAWVEVGEYVLDEARTRDSFIVFRHQKADGVPTRL